MNEDQKTYELGYLLKTSDAHGEVIELLKKQQAQIVNQPTPAEIKLAYPVKKHQSAFFGYVHFSAPPEAIAKIKPELALNQNVLRFLIINYSPKDYEKTPRPSKYSSAKVAAGETTEVKPVGPEILSNEALEKKLEEILK